MANKTDGTDGASARIWLGKGVPYNSGAGKANGSSSKGTALVVRRRIVLSSALVYQMVGNQPQGRPTSR
jgi:hypothetical protein